MQFLDAVSHSVGAHSNAMCESDDEIDGDAERQEQLLQPSATQPNDHADMCEDCLVIKHLVIMKSINVDEDMSSVPQINRHDFTCGP